jgi:N-acyl-L-homoserine lactone synthetase
VLPFAFQVFREGGMLAHIINRHNRAAYGALCDAMFVQRHRVFVEQMGWAALHSDDGRERDAYDALDEVVYIVTTDAAGDILGSARMIPTMGDHMLAGPLAAFVERDYTRAPNVWELTRYAPLPAGGAKNPHLAMAALSLGLLEWTVRAGVTTAVAACPTDMAAFCSRIGHTVRMLGMPKETPEGPKAVAIEMTTGLSVLKAAREFWKLERSVSFEAGPPAAGEAFDIARIAALTAVFQGGSIKPAAGAAA